MWGRGGPCESEQVNGLFAVNKGHFQRFSCRCIYLFIIYFFVYLRAPFISTSRKKHNKGREWEWFNNEIFFYFSISLVPLSVWAWRYESYSYFSASLKGNKRHFPTPVFSELSERMPHRAQEAPAEFPLMGHPELSVCSFPWRFCQVDGRWNYRFTSGRCFEDLRCSYSFPAKLWCVQTPCNYGIIGFNYRGRTSFQPSPPQIICCLLEKKGTRTGFSGINGSPRLPKGENNCWCEPKRFSGVGWITAPLYPSSEHSRRFTFSEKEIRDEAFKRSQSEMTQSFSLLWWGVYSQTFRVYKLGSVGWTWEWVRATDVN